MACNVETAGSSTHGDAVAKHYNQLEEKGLEQRVQSRIYYMRNFNNWLKSILIGDVLQRIRKQSTADSSLAVLDMCSGKGGDLLKWKKGRIGHLICADIAETSVQQCQERYNDMGNRGRQERYPSHQYTAEFIAADCSKQRLRDMYKNPDIQLDLTSCQFSLHYSFESYEQADKMLQNACENLKPGGYFIGTTPDANELVKRLRASSDMSFGNEVFRITFLTENKEDIPLFGAKYDFHLEGVVDCPEFVVHFPLLEKMAEKYNMKLVQAISFADYFKEQISLGDARGLIGRMQSLEAYPPDEDIELVSKEEDAYDAAKQRISELSKEESEQEHGRRRPPKVGTLSKAEWEATTIYLVYIFQKQSPEGASQATSSHQEPQSDTSEPPAKVQRT